MSQERTAEPNAREWIGQNAARWAMRAEKVGAVFYFLWGVLHIGIGGVLLSRLWSGDAQSYLAFVGSALAPSELGSAHPPVVVGLLAQHAWNLIVFGAASATVAVTLNWRNSRVGFWVNLGLVSAADLGFIGAVFVPGFIRFADGIGGPVLWVLAAVFSSIGFRRNTVS